MYLYMRQRVFSWRDKFYIYDKNGNEMYYVEGELLSLGKKLHLYDMAGNELAFIEQKLFSWLPKYYVHRPSCATFEVVQAFSFFRPVYFIDGLGWQIKGDFFNHSYEITGGYNNTVASVAKELFTFGDAYRIDIRDAREVVPALATVLVIDACIEAQQRSN